jgi:hypothetical protein
MVTGPTIATAGIGWTAIGNASNFGRINSSPPTDAFVSYGGFLFSRLGSHRCQIATLSVWIHVASQNQHAWKKCLRSRNPLAIL